MSDVARFEGRMIRAAVLREINQPLEIEERVGRDSTADRARP
jgi:hypothetical protein